MSWPPNFMYEVDWGAIATLATGFVAVASATWVATWQTKILKRQTELALQTIRVDLLQDRKSLIVEFEELWFAWSASNRLNFDQTMSLYRISQHIRLIFPEAVHTDISKCCSIFFRILRLFEAGQRSNVGSERQAELLEERFALEREAELLMEPLLDRLISLARVDIG